MFARPGPQPLDEGGLYGGGNNAALAELRERLEALEARVDKRDRVFQRLLTLLGSDGPGS